MRLLNDFWYGDHAKNITGTQKIKLENKNKWS